jgi:protein-disulfide isomerase
MFHDSTNEGKGIFDAIPSKTSFFAGLIAGIMLFSTIGFVVTLAGGISLPSFGSKATAFGGVPAAAAPTPSPDAPPAVGTVPPVTKDEHVRGNLDKADVVLVEYSDFECPFCKSFAPTMNQVLKEYGDKVALVFRHFPLSFHANAQKEAEASECVAELGGNDKFWQFHDKIFERTTSNGTGIALTDLGPLAKEIGVNQANFQKCLDSGKYAKLVQDSEAGGSAAGVNGTPGTIALSRDGKSAMISGAQPLASVKTTIDGMLPK